MPDPTVYANAAFGRMINSMRRPDFHFDLPQELIAQRPTETRSASRMLLLDGADGSRRDLQFRDFPPLLEPLDLLVFNDTRVIPARVFGVKESRGPGGSLLARAPAAAPPPGHPQATKGPETGGPPEPPRGPGARRARP